MRCRDGAAVRIAVATRTHRRANADLMEAIPVVIAGVLAPAMAHRLMVKALFRQPVVDVILIGIHAGSRRDEPLDERADRGLLDVLQHPDDHRTALLNHHENQRLFLL